MNTFLLIITQFTLVLLINKYYLKQNIYRSDIIAFFILIIAYSISFFSLISNLGLRIEGKARQEVKDLEQEGNSKVDKK